MTTITNTYTISDVKIFEVAAENGEVIGYIRRTPTEVPARGVFYPCTTTKIVWNARYKSGKYIEFLTRKAAVAYIEESDYYAKAMREAYAAEQGN